MSLLPLLRAPATWLRSRTIRRSAVALALAFGGSLTVALASARHRNQESRERLDSAALRLEELTDASPADSEGRSAIAWGYAERLRLGLESPFRLIEAAARDPRLHPDERRTVSWALLANVLRGESHVVDPAVLDGIAENDGENGERHLALIDRVIRHADNPRAGELALRLAYELAGSERVVDGAAAQVVANVAALVADREIARREAASVVRSARNDPVDEIRARRGRHAFYVERPVLLVTDVKVEREALGLVSSLLDSVRAIGGEAGRAARDSSVRPRGLADAMLARRLYAAGADAAPAAPLAVTVKRFLPLVRGSHLNVPAIERSRNAEMLVAAASGEPTDRATRRVLGRLLVSSAVSMRSMAQQPVWFPGDSVPGAGAVAAALGVAAITFDRDVPPAWRPYFLLQLRGGVTDLRRVFPALDLASLKIRFRMKSPVDSALAMHDPRTRTLHLPVLTAGGTLTHELAHDLDRQVAARLGNLGYRSDYVARLVSRPTGRALTNDERVASALQALTEEFDDTPRPTRRLERPAEIFATRVDWFVAQALGSRGLSSGFLSGVQDELLTGHVVHPDRLRSAGRTRSLIVALQGMTTVAPFAAREDEPSVQALLRWALSAPVDRDVASGILRGAERAWEPTPLGGDGTCHLDDGRAALVRLAAEARARGWIRLRARWMAEARRPAWARAALGQGPWSQEAVDDRVRMLRDYILTELSVTPELSAGIPAYGAPLAGLARCS